ncbi:MAG: ammonia-forming cytochrome c nitrite reductase subunit c552, partial [Propionibacteriaceae bacterium]|nr:ammonia-forming cytochrome c nitrite reductase subunit c552 [Propionibacteriaceae bacterium]
GVTCADCHMAYERVGAKKVADHFVTSPMADINGTCGTCHTQSDELIEQEVTKIQNVFVDSRDRTLDSLVQLINAIATAQTDGTPADRIELAQSYQNFASFYVDYAYSENSYGFHAPDYFQRILNQSLDASRKGQLALLGVSAADLEPSAVAQANTEKANETGLI